ncbi:peptidase domain-containing protein [Methanolobus sp. WCC1]|uniref:peptidase domain-containing protein n=1 Tax=unclassified Methanolobus TaxID=2629569 RepID=UPI00324E696B
MAMLIILLSVNCAVADTNSISNEVLSSDYIVTSAKNNYISFPVLRVSDTITQGETNWHTKTVSSDITTLTVNLNWGDSSDSLRLIIYTPDNNVLGPFYDDDDGSINGRINIDITNSNGIAKGTWQYCVYGYDVSGTQSYTI